MDIVRRQWLAAACSVGAGAVLIGCNVSPGDDSEEQGEKEAGKPAASEVSAVEDFFRGQLRGIFVDNPDNLAAAWETALASDRPVVLEERGNPTRYYLPREDVRLDLLTNSEESTVCAYKGIASYLSMDGAPDVAWFCSDPLHDALPVRDLVCFWRPATVYVDGKPVDTSMPGQ